MWECLFEREMWPFMQTFTPEATKIAATTSSYKSAASCTKRRLWRPPKPLLLQCCSSRDCDVIFPVPVSVFTRTTFFDSRGAKWRAGPPPSRGRTGTGLIGISRAGFCYKSGANTEIEMSHRLNHRP
ncbi:hypothetical protein J6590_045885 [Homalodisca vitripennis]|nr:hypothetical protein J6590_045885 [Homalodisca vitripennis]